jgi:hypothetical protein
VPSEHRDEVRADLGLLRAAFDAGVVPTRARSQDSYWAIWTDFSLAIGADPTLVDVDDPVLLLQLFAQRYRDGRIAPRHNPVKSRTVEDALRAVGQGFARVGTPDPRLTESGKLDFRLLRQLKGYTRADPPPARVKPIPVSVIIHALNVAAASNTADSWAVADMACTAFFFLLRPGKYTSTPSDTRPFQLCDVQLFIGLARLDIFGASDADLNAATFTSYTFTTQKNGVRGEVIGLGRSGSPLACPVLATVRRVLHLRAHHASPDTPLATYYRVTNGRTSRHPVTPPDITAILRMSVHALGPALGFLPTDISTKSLWAGGAMALLLAQVDTDIIRLLGRWRSDEMLRYLHLQAQPVMLNFTRRMLQGGVYTLLPGQDVPPLDIPNPQMG